MNFNNFIEKKYADNKKLHTKVILIHLLYNATTDWITSKICLQYTVGNSLMPLIKSNVVG